MTLQEQIDHYLSGQPEAKRSDLRTLHALILAIVPDARLWFLDGKDGAGKTVSNPNIGYGAYAIRYANGSTRTFYRVGLSANTGGISVYVMGLADKTLLSRTYGQAIGKASVSGYCIKFKSLKDIDIDVLESAIRHRMELPGEGEGRRAPLNAPEPEDVTDLPTRGQPHRHRERT